jgi:thymidylate kinase
MAENICAAYLAHPKLNIPPELLKNFNSKAFMKNMYDILKINKVLMRTLNYAHLPGDSLKKATIRQLIEKSDLFRDAYVFMANLMYKLLNAIGALKANGVEPLFIKSASSLPLDSDNFDILIMERDLEKCTEVLSNLGFVEVVKAREPYKLLFRKVKDGEDYLALHVHMRVAWEGVEFINLNELWNRRQKLKIDETIICTPSYEDDLLITAAHLFFENHSINLGELLHFAEILDNHPNVDWDYIISSVENGHWTLPFCVVLLLTQKLYYNLYCSELIGDDVFDDIFIKCGVDRKRVECIVKRLIKKFRYGKMLPLKLPLTLVAHQYFSKIFKDERVSINRKFKIIYSMVVGFIKRRLALEKTGYNELICFIGIDGSGKTTHAKLLVKELAKRGIKSKYSWTRGSPFFSKPLVSLFKGLLKIRKPYMEEEKNQQKKVSLPEPYRTLWAILLLLDHLIQILVKVKIPLMFGQTIICDRYIYDTFIDIQYEFHKNYEETIIGKVIKKMLPKPSIVFITDSDSKEIAKRRPGENSEELLNLKRFEYLRCHFRGGNFYILDTTRHINENKRKTISLALTYYYRGSLRIS